MLQVAYRSLLNVWVATIAVSMTIVIATMGYVALFRASDFSPSRPVALALDFEAAMPRYREHLRILNRLREVVEAEHARAGRYPNSRAQDMLPVDALFEDNPTLGRATDFKVPGPGSLEYRSDGNRYKMLMTDTGDCFVAQILKPELRDPRRSPGSRDCVSYGYWSKEGRGL